MVWCLDLHSLPQQLQFIHKWLNEVLGIAGFFGEVWNNSTNPY
jgi:hypothetical protein